VKKPPPRAAEIDRLRKAWYDGGRRTLLYNRRLATPLREGVKLMGRKRLYAVLRFLVCLALWGYILTIKAC